MYIYIDIYMYVYMCMYMFLHENSIYIYIHIHSHTINILYIYIRLSMCRSIYLRKEVATESGLQFIEELRRAAKGVVVEDTDETIQQIDL